MKHRNLTAIWISLTLFPLAASPPETPKGLDFAALGARIVERLDPRPGERILLAVKGDSWTPLVEAVLEGLAARGAASAGVTDVGTLSADEIESRRLLEGVDAALILPGPTPEDPLYAAIQQRLKRGLGRAIHFHWAGAYPVPDGPEPAQSTIDETYQRSLLQTDYAALGRSQREFAEAIGKGETRVTTPQGTDLVFRVGARPVTIQDGDASARRAELARNLIDREIELPAGAIRVAPLEDSVKGVIAFPPAVWGGEQSRGLRLRFEKGKVVGIEAESGRIGVEKEFEAGGPAARSFREFALGFNPTLAIPADNPWIPYYGYGAGVVRLSLGDNTELGGRVAGGYVRWNFFTNATVTVDGQVWVRDGKLTR